MIINICVLLSFLNFSVFFLSIDNNVKGNEICDKKKMDVIIVKIVYNLC